MAHIKLECDGHIVFDGEVDSCEGSITRTSLTFCAERPAPPQELKQLQYPTGTPLENFEFKGLPGITEGLGCIIANPAAPSMTAPRKATYEEMHTNSIKPVHISRHGLLFDGEPFPYPVAQNSVKVERLHNRNILTFSIFIEGEVTFEARPEKNAPAPNITVDGVDVPPSSVPDGLD